MRCIALLGMPRDLLSGDDLGAACPNYQTFDTQNLDLRCESAEDVDNQVLRLLL